MKSVYEYLQEDRVKWKDLPYISVKTNGRFAARTFGEVVSDAEALARGLISEGIRGNVMLYSPNSYYWAVADLAVLGYVGTIVPIYSEWTAFDIERTLSVIEVGAILYSAEKRGGDRKASSKATRASFCLYRERVSKTYSKGTTKHARACREHGRKCPGNDTLYLRHDGSSEGYPAYDAQSSSQLGRALLTHAYDR